METYEVIYGCETKDGGTGFGEGKIMCENLIDAKAVWQAIQDRPDSFDFAPKDGGRRLVCISGNTRSTVYLDD